MLHICAKKNFRDVAEFILTSVQEYESNQPDFKKTKSSSIVEVTQILDDENNADNTAQ